MDWTIGYSGDRSSCSTRTTPEDYLVARNRKLMGQRGQRQKKNPRKTSRVIRCTVNNQLTDCLRRQYKNTKSLHHFQERSFFCLFFLSFIFFFVWGTFFSFVFWNFQLESKHKGHPFTHFVKCAMPTVPNNGMMTVCRASVFVYLGYYDTPTSRFVHCYFHLEKKKNFSISITRLLFEIF